MFNRKAEENGNVLRAFMTRFNKKKTEENLYAVLRCFRDSMVWVPVEEKSSNPEKQAELDARKGEEITREDGVLLKPDFLKNGEKIFFPVFTNVKQMGREYVKEFSRIEVTALEAVEMAQKKGKTSGIVIDPFTHPFAIPRDLFKMIKGLPQSKDDDDEYEE